MVSFLQARSRVPGLASSRISERATDEGTVPRRRPARAWAAHLRARARAGACAGFPPAFLGLSRPTARRPPVVRHTELNRARREKQPVTHVEPEGLAVGRLGVDRALVGPVLARLGLVRERSVAEEKSGTARRREGQPAARRRVPETRRGPVRLQRRSSPGGNQPDSGTADQASRQRAQVERKKTHPLLRM